MIFHQYLKVLLKTPLKNELGKSQTDKKKFPKDVYNKGLEFRIHKELLQISNETQKILKIGKYLTYTSER